MNATSQYISCNTEGFKENSIYCKIYFVDVLPAIFFSGGLD